MRKEHNSNWEILEYVTSEGVEYPDAVYLVTLALRLDDDEVAEMEEDESDKRLARIDYLIPLLYAYSHSLAEGAVEYQRENASAEVKDLPEELWRESRRMMEQVTMSALMGGISQIVDMGLLEIPRKKK
jgi:hypothetical protein